MKYLGHFLYTIKHIIFVAYYCFRFGVLDRAVKHDWSKFKRDEWGPYANTYFDNQGRWHKPKEYNDDFLDARQLHIERNNHHWEHWAFTNRKGERVALKIPDRVTREMIADWKAAARMQGNDAREWYQVNKDNLTIHPKTRRVIEELL